MPYSFHELWQDLKNHAVLLLLFLAYHTVAQGVPQALFLAGRFSDFKAMVVAWIVIVPLLALVYAIKANKLRRADLPLTITLGTVWCVCFGHSVLTLYGFHNAGWIRTEEIGTAINVLAVGGQLLIGLPYYAYVSVAEELFFRGVLFELLQSWRVKAGSALVFITAVLFGAAHLVNFPQFQGLGDAWRMFLASHVAFATLVGVILGIIYLRRRNLLLVSFLHWCLWVGNMFARVLAGVIYLYLS